MLALRAAWRRPIRSGQPAPAEPCFGTPMVADTSILQAASAPSTPGTRTRRSSRHRRASGGADARVLPGDRRTSRTSPSPRRSTAARPERPPKKTLLLSTGAEATENAVKIAREYTRRPAVIAFTARLPRPHAARALDDRQERAVQTALRAVLQRNLSRTVSVRAPRGRRRAHALERRSTSSSKASSHPIASPRSSSNRCSARAASFPHRPSSCAELRRICDEHGIVLIADEMQTGFGRTGTFFACEHYGIEPDLITVAKSLAGGLPLAAVVGKAEIMDAPEPGGLGGTFAGNPIACAAALAIFEIMDDAFLARAREIGARIFGALRALQEAFRADRRRARARRDGGDGTFVRRRRRSSRRRASAACC